MKKERSSQENENEPTETTRTLLGFVCLGGILEDEDGNKLEHQELGRQAG